MPPSSDTRAPASRAPGSLRRAHVVAAAATLCGLLAGHTILEIARDSLFLSRVSADQLPGTYLAIALAATLAAQLDARLLRKLDDRRTLALTLAVGGAGAALFHGLFATHEPWVPHTFYVWTGTIASIGVAQFWRLLAEVFTVAEAKRLFAPIGAGGALGAMAGAAAAEIAQRWLDPRGLLWIGGAVLAASALVPGLLPATGAARAAVTRRAPERRAQIEGGARHYARRLLLLVAITAMVATLVDFTFKSTVDEQIPPGELGTFFSRFYFGLNLLSLVVQLVIAPRLLQLLGVTRALVVLPITLAIGAGVSLAVGGVVSAMLLRGADGALRQSLHRSATEVLYFPFSSRARKRYKASVDALGQRSGQALGSLLILGALAIGLGPRELAAVVVVLASAMALVVLALRGGYLDLLRANLRAGAIETRVDVPQLDLQSLESLIASLSSERDEEVLATLDLLRAYDRIHLVPALLLYHPSRAVVLRTMELLGTSERVDFVPIAQRLLAHEDDEIAAAAMQALARTLPADALCAELERRRGSAAGAVVLVALVARGLDHDGAARREIEECIAHGAAPARLALARAVRLQGDTKLDWVLFALATRADVAQRREIARAFGALRDPSAVGLLIHWVGERGTRGEVRDALVAIGEPAMRGLGAALDDPSLPRELRAHLPRTLSRFVDPRAAQLLFAHLDHEPDGWVRYKILRALRSLREALPGVRFDPAEIERRTHHALARATRVLGQRVALERAHQRDASLRTPGGALVSPVLREKEEQAIARAILLIALGHPRESVNGIAHALRSDDRRVRAESRELLAHLAPSSCAPVIDALLDDTPDEVRLARALAALGQDRPRETTYASLLREMIGDESDAVRCVAAHHAGELALGELTDALVEAEQRAAGLSRDLSRDVVRRVLGDLGQAARATRDASGGAR